jgi:hypothetical protein
MEEIIMKNLYRKSVIISVIVLFLAMCLSPMIAADNIKENNNDDIIFEFSTVDLKGSTTVHQISISENEFIDLKNKLSGIMEELRFQTNDEEAIDLLKSYLDVNEYPILSRIFSKLFNFDFIGKRKLVISQGMGPNFNPFKESKTAIIKPFTTWLYSDANNFLPIPSSTGVLSMNPFKIKTYTGPQFGFMLRFRGIYVNIGQPSSMQSYTFFIGTARYLFFNIFYIK